MNASYSDSNTNSPQTPESREKAPDQSKTSLNICFKIILF